jgi:hypothetical protein
MSDSSNRTCDICGSSVDVELCSSGLGPVSYCRCLVCQSKGAEDIGVVCYWLFTHGGTKTAPDHFSKVISYADGRYIDHSEICRLYPELEAEFVAEAEADDDDELIEEDLE